MQPPGDAEFAANVAAWNHSYLRSEHAAGPSAFEDDRRWQIIDAELAKRGLSAESVASSLGTSTSPAARSPWFLVSRLAGSRWSPSVDLPLAFLKVAVFVSGLYAAVQAVELIQVATEYFGYHLFPNDARFPWTHLLNTAWPALFALCLASRRPWGWYGAIATMTLRVLGWFGQGASLGTAALVWAVLIWLYLARRRRQFGLRPWPFVM
jgi:hypothetical protein